MKVIVIPAQAGIWIRNKGVFKFIAGCGITLFFFFPSLDSCLRRNDDKSVSDFIVSIAGVSFQ
jgi:hypothetical protein